MKRSRWTPSSPGNLFHSEYLQENGIIINIWNLTLKILIPFSLLVKFLMLSKIVVQQMTLSSLLRSYLT